MEISGANIIMNILGFLTILLGLFSFIPCIIAGAMGMDSPQAQRDPLTIFICYSVLTFPLVSIISGILSLMVSKRWQIYFVLIPFFEMLLIFLLIIRGSNG